MANLATPLAKMIFFHTYTWTSRNKEAFPKYVFATIAAYVVVTAVAFTLAVEHPAAAEIIQNFLISIGLLMNYALACMALLATIGFATWNFTKGIHVSFAGESAALLPAHTGAFDISPDILVMSMPGETAEAFDARLQAAREQITPQKWVVAFRFQHPQFMVFNHADAIAYRRSEPVFQEPDIPDFDGRIAPANTMFTTETPAQFAGYVREFVRLWVEFAPAKKTALAPTASAAAKVFSWAPVFLLLLFCAPSVAAQKLEQVQRTEIANEVPPAGTAVVFSFETSDCPRTADGRKSYAKLLPNIPAYKDDRGGRLLSIWAGRECVYKAPRVEAAARPAPSATADVMRPYGDSDVPPPSTYGPVETSWPDSAQLVQKYDGAKRTFSIWKTKAWQNIRPTWSFVMWCFWQVFFLLLLIGGMLRYYAKSASKEGIRNAWGENIYISPMLIWVHQNASAGLLIIVWLVAGVWMINVLMTLVSFELPIWLIVVLWSIVLHFTGKATDRIVPNIHVAGNGGGGYRGGGGAGYLNSGQ